MTVGDLSVTATLSGNSSNTSADAYKLIAKALADEWNDKYGPSGDSPNLAIWGNADGDSTSGTITFSQKASSRGSRGFGDTFAIAWNSAAATAARAAVPGAAGAAAAAPGAAAPGAAAPYGAAAASDAAAPSLSSGIVRL